MEIQGLNEAVNAQMKIIKKEVDRLIDQCNSGKVSEQSVAKIVSESFVAGYNRCLSDRDKLGTYILESLLLRVHAKSLSCADLKQCGLK
jgi:hypothetical protein